jgi:hypothetical protein
MTWVLDTFRPSDGRGYGGVPVDHQAWIRRERGETRAVFMVIQLDSVIVGEPEARLILDAMIKGLNEAQPTNKKENGDA